jgi:hypothetical protein
MAAKIKIKTSSKRITSSVEEIRIKAKQSNIDKIKINKKCRQVKIKIKITYFKFIKRHKESKKN